MLLNGSLFRALHPQINDWILPHLCRAKPPIPRAEPPVLGAHKDWGQPKLTSAHLGNLNCFSPPHPLALPLCALTQACCTLESPSLCRRHRSSSRSQRGSRCPTLRLSPAPLAPWARTSQTCSAACEGETRQRWDRVALHYEQMILQSNKTELLYILPVTPTFFFLCTLKWQSGGKVLSPWNDLWDED